VAHCSRLHWLFLTLPLVLAAPLVGADEPGASEGPAPAEQPAEDPLAAENVELVERLRAVGERRNELERQAAEATGSRRRILEEQVWNAQLEFQRVLREIGENLTNQQQEGRDISEMRDLLTERLRQGWPGFRKRLEWREARLEELRVERDAATGEERLALEKEFTAEVRRILISYEVVVDATVAFAAIGIDVAGQRTYLAEKLPFWAEELAAVTRVGVRARQEAQERLKAEPDDVELKRKLEVEEERLDRATESLSAIAALMDRVDLETATYWQLLVESTGEITTDVLDTKVALGLLQRWREQLTQTVVSQGPRWLLNGLVFVLILMAFRGLAALTRRLVSRSVSSSRVRLSQLLRDTLVSWSSRVVMAVGVLVALSQLGVQIGPLLAGLGIAGFIIGFALQDSLSNFAAGAMILAYRPYDVGDVIEAGGVRGKVSRMSLVSTTFLTFDNQTLIVPNSKIWGDVIRNVTAQEIRRIDLVFGISYKADVDHAEAVFRDVLAKNEKVLSDPEPIVEVHNLGESSVEFAVRPWVRTEDYWPVYWRLTREVKKRLDQEGISIPFPQRDVHLHVTTASQREEETVGSSD
jgi:small conductance mechanosensitive channel